MEGIMQGSMPPPEFSEYAFLAVVCNIRCRICSFEAFSVSCHPSLKSAFIESMDAAMSTLSQAMSQMNYEHSSPLHRHTNSALNSAFLHLYSSHELSGMKRLLRNPEVLHDSQEMSSLFDSPFSPRLKRGLICAAKALQLDFETGINYVRLTAPLRFDPLEIHALCESGKFHHPATAYILKFGCLTPPRSPSLLVPYEQENQPKDIRMAPRHQ